MSKALIIGGSVGGLFAARRGLDPQSTEYK